MQKQTRQFVFTLIYLSRREPNHFARQSQHPSPDCFFFFPTTDYGKIKINNAHLAHRSHIPHLHSRYPRTCLPCLPCLPPLSSTRLQPHCYPRFAVHFIIRIFSFLRASVYQFISSLLIVHQPSLVCQSVTLRTGLERLINILIAAGSGSARS